MRADLAQATFRQVDHQRREADAPHQIWECVAPLGHVFGKVEIWTGETQWGVRLIDSAPDLSEPELLAVVSNFLVWTLKCPAETVEVVLARSYTKHLMIRTGPEYV
jgi:hypothetical protein